MIGIKILQHLEANLNLAVSLGKTLCECVYERESTTDVNVLCNLKVL